MYVCMSIYIFKVIYSNLLMLQTISAWYNVFTNKKRHKNKTEKKNERKRKKIFK